MSIAQARPPNEEATLQNGCLVEMMRGMSSLPGVCSDAGVCLIPDRWLCCDSSNILFDSGCKKILYRILYANIVITCCYLSMSVCLYMLPLSVQKAVNTIFSVSIGFYLTCMEPYSWSTNPLHMPDKPSFTSDSMTWYFILSLHIYIIYTRINTLGSHLVWLIFLRRSAQPVA